MIPRYARDKMVSIWSPETKFRIWFEIEAHATDALAELGVVPKEAAAKVWEKGRDAKFDVERIDPRSEFGAEECRRCGIPDTEVMWLCRPAAVPGQAGARALAR